MFDGESQTEKWRQGTKGMLRDWDGDPIANQYNLKDMKHHNTHAVRSPTKRKVHRPKMAERKISD